MQLEGRQRWFALCTLYLLIFIDHFARTLVLIFLAGLLLNPKSPLVAHATSLGTRHFLYAVLVAVNPLMEIISEPFVGAISDLYGRRKILLWTTLIGLVAYGIALGGIYASSIALVIIGRGLGGVASSNISLASAGITDLTTTKNRGRFMAIISVMEGCAWVLGPAVGSFLADKGLISWFGPDIPFWLLVCLFAIAYALLQFVMREMHSPSRIRSLSVVQMGRDYLEMFRMGQTLRTFLIFAAVVIGQLLFVYFFALYLIERYQLKERTVAEVFAYFAIWRFVGGMIANQLFRWLSAKTLVLIPMWILGGACVAFIWLDNPINLYWVVPVTASAQAIVIACFYTLFANQVGEGMRGKIFAAWESTESAVLITVPFLIALFTSIWINLPNLIGGLLVFGAAIWYRATMKQSKRA